MEKRLKASSIVEVVIAISIIAICIVIASLVFIRTNKVITNFETVKQQTELESEIWKSMYLNTSLVFDEDILVDREKMEDIPHVEKITLKNLDQTVIWEQYWLVDEKK